MYGYKIKINSLPELVWACETTVDNYEWQNRNSKDMLEISFAKFDTISITVNNKSCIMKKSLLSCVMANEKRKAFCKAGEPITIVSIAVKFSRFNFEPHIFTKADYSDNTSILLPACLENLSLFNELELINTMHEIIKYSLNNAENTKAAFVSIFFKLLYKIDLMTRNKSNEETANNYYIKKANYIIESKYNEKITLQTVAAELNISPVYLSTMYKENSGINFSKQILNVRMKHAERLLIDQNIPTSRIAILCGFCDEIYFRKKFKQFFGMNVREYRQIKNGLTLYHEKPERKNNV